MNCSKEAMLLYAVTDRAWVGKQTLLEQVECAIKGGATCLQLREKDMPEDEFLAEALEVKKLCREYNIPFIIDDNVDLAIKCGADGVHVGQSDMEAGNARKLLGPDMIMGVSAQTVEQAVKAEKEGADYLGVGAVFSTSTKPDADNVSHEELKKICENVNIPVVAIGGISRKNIMELSGTGVDGVAIISAIFGSPDIEEECRKLKSMSEEMIKR